MPHKGSPLIKSPKKGKAPNGREGPQLKGKTQKPRGRKKKGPFKRVEKEGKSPNVPLKY